MAATAPVEIGTRGTIGSLLLQEIEYFRQLELDRRETLQKQQTQTSNVDDGSSGSRTKSESAVVTVRKKKKKRGGAFLPSICSAVEVKDNKAARMHGFSYRSLKTDSKKVQS